MNNQMKDWMIKTSLIAVFAGILLLFSGRTVYAQIAVVVSIDNPVEELSEEDLKAIFLGRTQNFENGEPIEIAEFEPVKNQFSQTTYNFSARRMSQNWFELIFSGSVTTPPKSFDSEEDFIEFISRNERAIGYIDYREVRSETDIKVLSIDGRMPGERGYFLAN